MAVKKKLEEIYEEIEQLSVQAFTLSNKLRKLEQEVEECAK